MIKSSCLWSFCYVAGIVCCNALSPGKTNPSPATDYGQGNNLLPMGRRAFLISSGCVLVFPNVSHAANPPASPRTVDVGGGVDLLVDARISQKDALFPISMEGPWICDRITTQIDGDSFQAEAAWRGLGGTGTLRPERSETFQTRFLRSPSFGDAGVVIDRGFEIASRSGIADVSWTVEFPDTLKYGSTKLKVVQRSVELPSDKGFGFNELIRIDDGPIIRAAQIKRRYRRAYDETGARVVEGLEIMKTFRVLDGVAGTEFPTSVTKSQIRLRRP